MNSFELRSSFEHVIRISTANDLHIRIDTSIEHVDLSLSRPEKDGMTLGLAAQEFDRFSAEGLSIEHTH